MHFDGLFKTAQFNSPYLIDFKKDIHIVFETLNEWFKVNQLSLNFNKTNFIYIFVFWSNAPHMSLWTSWSSLLGMAEV